MAVQLLLINCTLQGNYFFSIQKIILSLLPQKLHFFGEKFCMCICRQNFSSKMEKTQWHLNCRTRVTPEWNVHLPRLTKKSKKDLKGFWVKLFLASFVQGEIQVTQPETTKTGTRNKNVKWTFWTWLPERAVSEELCWAFSCSFPPHLGKLQMSHCGSFQPYPFSYSGICARKDWGAHREQRNSQISSEKHYAMDSGPYMLLRTTALWCPEVAEHAAKQMKVETDLNCKCLFCFPVYNLLGRQQMRNVRGRREAGEC